MNCSSKEEPFKGFEKQDIEVVLKRSADLLEKEAGDEVQVPRDELEKPRRGRKKSKVKTEGILDKSQTKAENDSLLSGLSSESATRSKRTTQKSEEKDSYFPKSRFFATNSTTAAPKTNKSMKGTIKIKFSGVGFYNQLSKRKYKKSRNKKDAENEDDIDKMSEMDDEIVSSPPGSTRKRKRSLKSPGSKDAKLSNNASKKSLFPGLCCQY